MRLNDVARLARVSAATVSRVLNSRDSVTPESRERVESAVNQLGYMRNGAARALRSRRSRIVGLIIPSIGHAIYASFVEALQASLARQNYSLIAAASDFSLEQELSRARVLAEHGVDGLVLIGHTHKPALFAFLHAQDLPYVMTYTMRPESKQPFVGFDNFAAGGKVANFLHDLGHRSFALLSAAPSKSDRASERVRGILAALEARGIVLPRERICEEKLTVEGGRVGLRRLIAAGECPTALICTSDVLAYGALIECASRAIAVPTEMSVTGFDGLEPSAHFHPPLTTVDVPATEMGRRAGEYLLSRLEGRPHADQIAIPANLVIRETTGPAPRRSN